MSVSTKAARRDGAGESITDTERIERFRRAGYGGSVADALRELGVVDTLFSERFTPLRQGMQLVGRALTVKFQSSIEPTDPEGIAQREQYWEAQGGHPQKKMMEAVASSEDGVILCFDCGADMKAAHFGEMSCQLAYAQGCRGMLIAGNCRDTHYILQMRDFPIYCYSTRPNALFTSIITDVGAPILLPGHITHYVKVTSGDFIFGDSDGVQLIPAELVDEVLARVERTYERENREREQLAAGMSIDEVYKNYGVL